MVIPGKELSSDATIRASLDHASAGVLIESRNQITYINDRYAEFLGYRDSHDLGPVSVPNIAHEEECDRLTWYAACRQKGEPAPNRYTFRARRRDHSTLVIEANVLTSIVCGELFITTIARIVLPPLIDASSHSIPDGLKSLSVREYQTLSLTLAGRRPKEIANTLGISQKTVSTHRVRAFRKLALRGDYDLFRYAADYGLLDDVEERAAMAVRNPESRR